MQPSTSPARAALARVRFARGVRILRMELSPRMTRREQRAVAFWIRRLPEEFTDQLPPLKLAVAERLQLEKTHVVIQVHRNPQAASPQQPDPPPRSRLHAASFIPQGYLLLDRRLFRRRAELGRILYHELTHFLWPKLGNPLRRSYEAMVQEEFRKGVRGELGYSAEWRKEKLRAAGRAVSRKKRLWREYICESFCDTAAYVLLGRERRAGHSEYTLSKAARERRQRWMGGWGVGE